MAERADRLATVANRLEECIAILERESGRRPSRVPDQHNLDSAYPYYGEEDGQLFVRAQERGQLVRDEAHDDVEGVVESLVTGAAVEVATAYEVRHRRPHEDSRRQWFHLSALWLGKVDPVWGDRLHAHHVRVLEVAPFDDEVWREVEAAVHRRAAEMDARRSARGPEPVRREPSAVDPGRHIRVGEDPQTRPDRSGAHSSGGAALEEAPPVRQRIADRGSPSRWVPWLVVAVAGIGLCCVLRLVQAVAGALT